MYAQVKILHKQTYMPNFFREQEQVEVLSGDELGGSFKVHHPVFIIIFQMLGGEKSQRDTALRWLDRIFESRYRSTLSD